LFDSVPSANRVACGEAKLLSGSLTPDDVARLHRDIESGYAVGLTRDPFVLPKPHALTEDAGKPPQRSPRKPSLAVCLVAKPHTRKATRRKAATLVQQGRNVTVIDLSYSTLFHKVRFTDDGYWLHTGGIWGKMNRAEPLFRRATRDERVNHIFAQISGVRSAVGLKKEETDINREKTWIFPRYVIQHFDYVLHNHTK
jgi:hypothetical protein